MARIRQRPFAPKSHEPGARRTWTQVVDGRKMERTGTVWSAAPLPATTYVIPDEPLPDEAFVVLSHGKSRPWRSTDYVATILRSAQRTCVRVLDMIRRGERFRCERWVEDDGHFGPIRFRMYHRESCDCTLHPGATLDEPEHAPEYTRKYILENGHTDERYAPCVTDGRDESRAAA